MMFDTRPTLPSNRRRFGIGLIGCGGIARCGHLPAYQKFGLRVAAATSRRLESVYGLGSKFDIGTRHGRWQDLIADPAVDIVDITVPHDNDRLAMVAAAAAAGKHVMMQKPFAHCLDNAQKMVDICEQAGVILAVNHNARWCPQYRAVRQAIADGHIGHPVFITHRMLNIQDSQDCWTPWYADAPRFQLIEYTVHHLDLIRYWTAREPDQVQALTVRAPSQRRQAEMIVSVQLRFGNDLLAVVSDHNAAFPGTEVRSEFHINGTEGCIDGRVMSDPMLCLRKQQGEDERLELEGHWFPDGFAGTMGELMCAIEENREPSISGRDNLNTLRLVFAAYDDIKRGEKA